MTGAALVVQADALRLPLPDASVDLVVTSPPYAFLRAYDTGYPDLEVGSEPTPQAYLEALWQATAEMARVLKPSGSIFVMLGDKYDSSSHHMNGIGSGEWTPRFGEASRAVNATTPRRPIMGRAKSLMGLPWRYAIGCMDGKAGDALILRSELIWSKPNGLLPESVTDRVRRAHEQVFHFVKQPRYYAAVDEVREPSQQRPGLSWEQRKANGHPMRYGEQSGALTGTAGFETNPLGKLPGSVWSIPSEPLRLPDHLGVQHYAAFSSEWPRRLILGWSPPGICLSCGQGRWPVVERESIALRPHHPERVGWDKAHAPDGREGDRKADRATILGYACACTPHTNHPGTGEAHPRGGGWEDATARPGTNRGHNQGIGPRANFSGMERVGPWREYHLDRWTPPPTRPAVVVDVFGGTGTTAMVARALGRIGISIDLSHPYCRAARWRIRHDAGKAISRTWTERQGQLL